MGRESHSGASCASEGSGGRSGPAGLLNDSGTGTEAVLGASLRWDFLGARRGMLEIASGRQAYLG
eukprot:1362662-Karenia_brevis.AAC.1